MAHQKFIKETDMNLRLIQNQVVRAVIVFFVCCTNIMADPNTAVKFSNSDSDLQAVKKKLKNNNPLTWVFTGDSITQGAGATHGWRSYPEHFAERVRWELFRKSDIVINTGISADVLGSILYSFDWRIARFKPDVVSVMIGTNDATSGEKGRSIFRKSLIEMVDRIRKLGAVPLFNTPNPICKDVYNGTRNDLPNYVQIIREVAADCNVILIDHWGYWQEKRNKEELLMSWLSDGLHPNEYGHRVMANEIFKRLDIYNPKSSTCQLLVQ